MSITLRRAVPHDAAAIHRMMSDPSVYAGLMQLPYPSEELWRARLAESGADGLPELHLVAEWHGELVGSAGLHPASKALRRRHAMMLGLSVMSSAQRRGVGSALMAALCNYADNWLGMLRIELSVYTDNLTAIRLYERHGFRIEGTHRAYALRDGQYVDAHAMARLHPRPPEAHWPAATAG
jgi:L-phenylalanine/L-methionine N-acetyltransferase